MEVKGFFSTRLTVIHTGITQVKEAASISMEFQILLLFSQQRHTQEDREQHQPIKFKM